MKILKWIGIFLLALIIIAVIAGIAMQKDLPNEGKSGEEADKLALKMENALGKQHWHDIQYVKWKFAGLHEFLWDKHRGLAIVNWDETSVFITPGTGEGKVFTEQGEIFSDAEKVKEAHDFFNNDMFWLVAPFKSFDEGSERKIIEQDGGEHLMITYKSGGSTPGDSYLWKLADDGTPVSYQMWTQILPIQGIEATWENWHSFGNGVKISHKHKIGPMDLIISDVKAGYSLKDMGLDKDPFELYLTQ